MVNVPLLLEQLRFVTMNPEKHDQSFWARRSDCGTVACLAGNTVIRSGIRLGWNDRRSATVTVGGQAIREAAQDLLGLSEDEANYLFYAPNLDGLWRAAGNITDWEISQEDYDRAINDRLDRDGV